MQDVTCVNAKTPLGYICVTLNTQVIPCAIAISPLGFCFRLIDIDRVYHILRLNIECAKGVIEIA